MKTINVLGTEYVIIEKDYTEDAIREWNNRVN